MVGGGGGLRAYYGYALERLATESRTAEEATGEVNANAEFCALFKTKLGDTRILMAAELDCSERDSKGRRTYVELKATREVHRAPRSVGSRAGVVRGGVSWGGAGSRETRGRWPYLSASSSTSSGYCTPPPCHASQLSMGWGWGADSILPGGGPKSRLRLQVTPCPPGHGREHQNPFHCFIVSSSGGCGGGQR